MNNSKFTLLLIALVGIGVFALPSTMSIFAGQHSFYNIDATGNQVPCQKCHGDVKAELSGPTAMAGSKAPHADFKCEYCHRAEAGAASGDDAYAKLTYSGSDTSGANVTLVLITSIQMYETGNFPKIINYQSGLTVDSWNTCGCVFELDGTTPFVNQTEYMANDLYPGKLSTGTNGVTYHYKQGAEISTRNSDGTPRDSNTASQNNAFNPRLVSLSGINENIDGAGSSEVVPGTKYHAASLVSCMECHGGEQEKGVPGYEIKTSEPYKHASMLIDGSNTLVSRCENCHYGLTSMELSFAAGGFQKDGIGLTTGNASEGSVEAHNVFVVSDDGINRYGYGASNGACVVCHTHVAVGINFTKGYLMSFDAKRGSDGKYSVGNFNVEGHANIRIYGNQSGNTYATSNMTYNWTSGETMYVNGTSTILSVNGTNDGWQ